MRKSLVLGACLLAVLGVVAGATAITDGQPDGNGHPYVALMVAQDANGVPLWRCSGTMLSSTVFLTAGHCTEAPAAHAELFYSPGPVATNPAYAAAVAAAAPNPVPCAGFTGYPCQGDAGGAVHTMPTFDPNAFYLHDAGVVVLSSPHPLSTYGLLPTANQLDTLKPSAHSTFTAVGYGLQKAFPSAAAWKEEAQRTRMVATPQLVQINTGFTGPGSLLLSNDAHTGGTCFGDSGGPDLLGGTSIVLGVNSYVTNYNCSGVGYSARVDVPQTLNWVKSFIP